MSDASDLDSDGIASPWPAFADLLAATTLLFLVLFAVFAIPAIGENARIKGEWQARQNALDSLTTALERNAGKNRVKVVRVGDYLLVRITGDATFPRDKSDLADLQQEGHEILQAFAEQVKRRKLLRHVDQIQVVGHTSSEGSDARNWQLSSERAATVALFLIDSGGLSPCKVTALGRGSYYPLYPDSARLDAKVWPEDRRIELEIRPVLLSKEGRDEQSRRCVPRRGDSTAAGKV